ncbi:hypothetical protein GVG95_001953 [Neisseria gonorrhoeae]
MGGEGIRKDCHHSENALPPLPPPRGREWVSADFSVAGGLKNNLNLQPLISGRLKKNARNINSGNFSGSLYRKAGGTNAASIFSDNL